MGVGYWFFKQKVKLNAFTNTYTHTHTHTNRVIINIQSPSIGPDQDIKSRVQLVGNGHYGDHTYQNELIHS